MNQRKTVEIMHLNVRIREKRTGKAYHGKYKNVSAKKCTTVNSNPASSRKSSLKNITPIIVATPVFDNNQTSSISCISITESNKK